MITVSDKNVPIDFLRRFRGIRSSDVKAIVGFFHQAFQIAIEAQKLSGPKLVDWRKVVDSDEGIKQSIHNLKLEVEDFASKFPLPGREDIWLNQLYLHFMFKWKNKVFTWIIYYFWDLFASSRQ